MEENFVVEVGIPTKDRYPNLAILLWSLCEQTYKNWIVTIVDDSENRMDIRELPYMIPILRRLDEENHSWRVEFGPKKGPHYCHQLVLDKARSSYIFRVDDDEILDRECLSELVRAWISLGDKNVGAIGPIVFDPSTPKKFRELPIGFKSFRKYQGKIDKETGENFGEHQWRKHPSNELQEVEHLYSTFLYSVNIGRNIKFDLGYDLPGHREETDFTYRMFQKGYKLYVQPAALVWHLRNPQGGIRTYSDSKLWENCQKRYNKKFGFNTDQSSEEVIKIFGGLGDHLCATPLFRSMKKTGKKVIVSSIYPYLLQGNKNIDELIFLNEERRYRNIRFENVYKWGFENSFEGKISEAFCKIYGSDWDGDTLDYHIYPEEDDQAKSIIDDKKVILIGVGGARAITQYIDTTIISPPKETRTQVKDWVKQEWKELVENLKKSGFLVFQAGISGEDKIDGCDKYLFDLDYRLIIAIMNRCITWVSVDSFLNHAGYAIGKPGVVLFGSTNPKIFGHDDNINLYHPEACPSKDCLFGNEPRLQWQAHKFSCESKNCMKAITVEEVFHNIKEICF
jgi:ADP-heptose:LPS heptosyltransferase